MDQETILRKHALYQKSCVTWSCDHARGQRQAGDLSQLRVHTGPVVKASSNCKSSVQDCSKEVAPPSRSTAGPSATTKSTQPILPLVYVAHDPLSSRRSRGTAWRQPWKDKGSTSAGKSNQCHDLHYQEQFPKSNRVGYESRAFVTKPRYGQLYEVKRDRQTEPIRWLWEEKFRLWRSGLGRPEGRESCFRRYERTVRRGQIKHNHQATARLAPSTARPHADLFAAFHNRKLANQRRSLAATRIQQLIRGWLVRRRIQGMKRQALLGLGRTWPTITKEYRELVLRVQARQGVTKTSCPFSLDQMKDYIAKREKYERVFERVSSSDKLSRDQLETFFNECGHFPTEAEINAAFSAVFKGYGSTAEVIFVLDCSTGLGPVGFCDQMTFVKDVVRYLHIGPHRVRVGMVPFNTDVFQAFGLLQFSTQEEVLRAIDNIKFCPGVTNTHIGLRTMRDTFQDSRPGVQKVAIVITDGQSANTQQTALEAKRAADDNITVFAVGVGNNIDNEELENIARDKSRVYTCSSYRTLIDLKHVINNNLCLKIGDPEAKQKYHSPGKATLTQSVASDETSRRHQKLSQTTTNAGEIQTSQLNRTAPLTNINDQSAKETPQTTHCTESCDVADRRTNRPISRESETTEENSDEDDESGSTAIGSFDNNTTLSVKSDTDQTDSFTSSDDYLDDRISVSSTIFNYDDEVHRKGQTEEGNFQGVHRFLAKDEALEILWTAYPPPASGLPKRKSRWIRPLVDGEEAWSLLDQDIIKATDFKVCLGLVVKSRLEREGVLTIPSDVRSGVEEVTTYEEAMQKLQDYLKQRRQENQRSRGFTT